MGLNYHHLGDADVRSRMLKLWHQEWDDLAQRVPRDLWPFGTRLTEDGWAAFEHAMPDALTSFNDDWLIGVLSDRHFWRPYDPPRRTKRGRLSKPVNYDKGAAVESFAIGEFNTAYVRGLASVLLERGATDAMVYRAGFPREPRNAYCSFLEGQLVSLEALIGDHRASYYPPPGRPDARSIPSGPHCHHSIHAIEL